MSGSTSNPVPPGALGDAAPDRGETSAPAAKPQTMVAEVRRWVRSTFERLGFEAPGRWLALLSLLVLLDILILSWVQIRAYDSYFTFAQDLGSINQAFYTTLHDHALLYYSANIPSGSNGTFMAVHFSPIVFLLLPVYAISSGPTTLLVMKVIALALGAFPVYGLAHRRLGSARWGFLLGAVYLVSPITMTLNWISFDFEVFLPVLILSAFYFLQRREYVVFFVFWVLGLATIESAAPLLALFAIVALLGSFFGPRLLAAPELRRERLALGFAIVVAGLWLLLAYLVVQSYSTAGGAFGSAYASRYTTLHAQSFLLVVPQAILHPDLAASAIAFQGSNKVVYLLLIFGGLAFLPVFGEARYLLPVLAWVGLALLSNSAAQYSVGSQYLGYVSPFLFAGAIGGIAYLRPRVAALFPNAPAAGPNPPVEAPTRRARWRLPDRREAGIATLLVVAVVASVAVANPFLPAPVGGITSIQFGFPTPDAHAQLLNSVIALMPPSAAVLTTSHLFPQVSDRLHAYVLPTGQSFAGSNTYTNSLDQFINESQYVLLDFTIDSFNSQVMQFYGNYTGFGIEVAAGGVFLLQRNWTAAPLGGFGGPTSTAFAGSAWANTKKVTVTQGNGTFVYATSPTSAKSNITLWSGAVVPRVTPGVYELSLRYILNPTALGALVQFKVTQELVAVDSGFSITTPQFHHYGFTFNRSDVFTSLNTTEINGTTAGLSHQTSGVASLIFTVSQLAAISTTGITLNRGFWILVSGFTLTWLGPPPVFDDRA